MSLSLQGRIHFRPGDYTVHEVGCPIVPRISRMGRNFTNRGLRPQGTGIREQGSGNRGAAPTLARKRMVRNEPICRRPPGESLRYETNPFAGALPEKTYGAKRTHLLTPSRRKPTVRNEPNLAIRPCIQGTWHSPVRHSAVRFPSRQALGIRHLAFFISHLSFVCPCSLPVGPDPEASSGSGFRPATGSPLLPTVPP